MHNNNDNEKVHRGPHTNKHTHGQTNLQTGPIKIHCAAKLSVQCNE